MSPIALIMFMAFAYGFLSFQSCINLVRYSERFHWFNNVPLRYLLLYIPFGVLDGALFATLVEFLKSQPLQSSEWQFLIFGGMTKHALLGTMFTDKEYSLIDSIDRRQPIATSIIVFFTGGLFGFVGHFVSVLIFPITFIFSIAEQFRIWNDEKKKLFIEIAKSINFLGAVIDNPADNTDDHIIDGIVRGTIRYDETGSKFIESIFDYATGKKMKLYKGKVVTVGVGDIFSSASLSELRTLHNKVTEIRKNSESFLF